MGDAAVDEQFVVLKRAVPRPAAADAPTDDTDFETIDALDDGRLRRGALLWRTFEDVPEGLALLLALSAATLLCMGPFAALAMAGRIPSADVSWNALTSVDRVGENWTVELLRWSLMAQAVLCGAAAVRYSQGPVRQLSLAVAQGAASGHGRVFTQGAVRAVETLAAVWPYAGAAGLVTAVWLLSLVLLPYKSLMDLTKEAVVKGAQSLGSYVPDPNVLKETVVPLSPHYLGERGLLASAVLAWLLAGEQVLVHQIGRQFNAPLYAERISRFVRAMWSLDVLRRASEAFHGRPRAHSHPYFARLWTPRAYPHAFAERMPHAILEVFLGLGGRAPGHDGPAVRRLFRFLAGRESSFCEADVAPYFAAGETAHSALFDGAPTGGVSLRALSRVVDDVYAERKTLVAVLLANSRVLRALDRLLFLAVLFVLLPVVVFFVFGLRASKSSMAAYTNYWPLALLLLKRVEETIDKCIAAIVFLFATHPYDVGDRVYIGPRAESYFVRGLGLLSTTFERWDGLIVAWPNAELATRALCNVRRTAAQSQLLELVLPALGRSPEVLLAEVARRFSEWVDARPADYVGVRLVPFELRTGCDLVCLVVLRHRLNFQDGTQRRARQSRFLVHVRAVLEDLGIEYASALQPLSVSTNDPVLADAIARLDLGLPPTVS